MRALGPLVLFLALVVALSGVLDALLISIHSGLALVPVVMWSVGVAAMLTLKFAGRSLAELGWGWGPTKYHVVAFFCPHCLWRLGLYCGFVARPGDIHGA